MTVPQPEPPALPPEQPPEEPPTRPDSETLEQLRFERQPMVRWFDPTQLATTALRVVISAIFGAYSDKREVQGAFEDEPRRHYRYADEGELWLDYIADLGDGFKPTYAMAHLLARESLDVNGQRLPRGRVLVMGGDQVYPTASRSEYENRTLGPYRAALPWTDPATSPHLFAIPGNHDWYDGLTNFLRFFCQDAWVGGWQTKQNRSYFALKLPRNWWLWAIDIQFDVYIDKPQLDYFRSVAEDLSPSDRVILVTGKPSWKHGTDRPNPSYENLRYLEEKLIERAGAEMPVALSGDDHYYARHEEAEEENRRQKITCGGGGAFTSATHHLEDRVSLHRGGDGQNITYMLRATYPPREDSEKIPLGALWRLPWLNKRFIRAAFAAYFIPTLLLQIPVRRELRRDEAANLWDISYSAASSKWVVYAGLVLLTFTVLFVPAKSLWWRGSIGFAHGLAHLVLLVILVAVSAWVLMLVSGDDWLLTDFLGMDWATRYDLLVAAIAAALGAVPASVLVALYLVLADRFGGERLGRHVTEVFAAQQLTKYKSFLRLHIGRDGTLTIYPIGIADVPDSEFAPEGEPTEPYFRPREEIPTHLIESPIVVPPKRLAGTAPPR